MINLLNAGRVPVEDQVEVVKVQMTDVARTWWLAEEERLEKTVTWERFSESFYEGSSPRLLEGRWSNNSSTYDKGVGWWMSMQQSS